MLVRGATATLEADPIRLVEGRILELLDDECGRWTQEQPELGCLFAELRRFVQRGGKRLRPSFCFWGAANRHGEYLTLKYRPMPDAVPCAASST